MSLLRCLVCSSRASHSSVLGSSVAFQHKILSQLSTTTHNDFRISRPSCDESPFSLKSALREVFSIPSPAPTRPKRPEKQSRSTEKYRLRGIVFEASFLTFQNQVFEEPEVDLDDATDDGPKKSWFDVLHPNVAEAPKQDAPSADEILTETKNLIAKAKQLSVRDDPESVDSLTAALESGGSAVVPPTPRTPPLSSPAVGSARRRGAAATLGLDSGGVMLPSDAAKARGTSAIRDKYAAKLRAVQKKAVMRREMLGLGMADEEMDASGARVSASFQAISPLAGVRRLLMYVVGRRLETALAVVRDGQSQDDGDITRKIDYKFEDVLRVPPRSPDLASAGPAPPGDTAAEWAAVLERQMQQWDVAPNAVMVAGTSEALMQAASERGFLTVNYAHLPHPTSLRTADFKVSNLHGIKDIVDDINGVSFRVTLSPNPPSVRKPIMNV